MARVLSLDIFDYSGNLLCPLYTSETDTLGQAINVYIQDERNGWRQLSFDLPTKTIEGEEMKDNFRAEFLKADYKIRSIEDRFGQDYIDWFLISQPKIVHNAFTKTLSVTAGHVSQLLKYKNLGLEFSDDEGNNVGTCAELVTTILAGTGWELGYCYPFADTSGATKYRSLKASSKTGAFKLITMTCDLFDAKPIFRGDDRTVDIVPMNPFSEVAPGDVPEYAKENGTVELHYGYNLKNVTRTLNTENIVTKLHARGSYGDKTSGICVISTCNHTEYYLTLKRDLTKGETYFFQCPDVANITINVAFTVRQDVPAGTRIVYSFLDPASLSYVWVETENPEAYIVTYAQTGTHLKYDDYDFERDDEVKNWFPYILDFDYYIECGLLTHDILQKIASFQREAPILYQAINEASLAMSNELTELSRTIGVLPFCKLSVNRVEPLLGNYLTLVLNYQQYDQGVIYRSDYDTNKDSHFKWITSSEMDSSGRPINTACSVLYVIHNTNPITWDKYFLKEVLDDVSDPKAITLWANRLEANIDVDTDSFYLFQFNGTSSYLGALESADESAVEALESATTIATETHDVIFTDQPDRRLPAPTTETYQWLWQYYPKALDVNNDTYRESQFYYYDKDFDTTWAKVAYTDTAPSVVTYAYWLNWRSKTLYRAVNNAWQKLESYEDTNRATKFGIVYYYGKQRDKYYQGVYKKQKLQLPYGYYIGIPAGNYYFEDGYGSFWAFTTKVSVFQGDYISYDTVDGWVTTNRDEVDYTSKGRSYRFDNVSYNPSNIITTISVVDEMLNTATGDAQELPENSVFAACSYNQIFLPVLPNGYYRSSKLLSNVCVHYYNDKKRWLGCTSPLTSVDFTTPNNCYFIRLASYRYNASDVDPLLDESVSISYYREYDGMPAAMYSNTIVLDNLVYQRLPVSEKSGEKIGILSCMNILLEKSDYVYDTLYNELKSKQDYLDNKELTMNESIGDIYREGWWEDTSYIHGDEDRLYEDALENLKVVAQPERSYTISFLDLYGSDMRSVDEDASGITSTVPWPDINIMSAAHLVDSELGINTWAYIDKIKKCYDKPWLTTITINTKLSTYGQHTFTDVMANIADVASEMKGKAARYDSTANQMMNIDLGQLSANIIANEQGITSSLRYIEEIGNQVLTHESMIRQTADEISTEVVRSSDAERKLSSSIKQTATDITAKIDDEVDDLHGAIKFTVEGLTAAFTKSDKDWLDTLTTDYKSDFRQTAIDLVSEFHKEVWSVNGRLVGYVSSSIEQAADTIIMNVESDGQGGEKRTTLRQTINGISTKVSDVDKNVSAVDGRVTTIESMSIIDQTSSTIDARVKTTVANTDSGKVFRTSHVTIADTGIDIGSTGTIKINSGGNLNIDSGGVFTVTSNNFTVDSNGRLTANSATLSQASITNCGISDCNVSGTLSSGGYPVITNGYDIYIGSNAPGNAHLGMLWIKPGDTSGGSGGGGGSVSVVSYSGSWYFDRGLYEVNNTYYTMSGSISTSASGSASGSTYAYTGTIRMYPRYTAVNGLILYLKVWPASNSSRSVTLSTTVSINSSGYQDFTLGCESSTWLGYNDELQFEVSTSGSSVQQTAMYWPQGTNTVTLKIQTIG